MAQYFKLSLSGFSLICLLIINANAQNKVGIVLQKSYSSQNRGTTEYFVKPNEEVLFQLQVNMNGFPEKKFEGKFRTYLSQDTLLSSKDSLVWETIEQVDYYANLEYTIIPSVPPGKYYFITRLEAFDSSYFAAPKRDLVQTLVIHEVRASIEKSLVYDYKISNINKETGFEIDLSLDLGCCFDSADVFRSEINVLVGPTEKRSASSIKLGTEWGEHRLGEPVGNVTIAQTLFEKIPASQAKFLQVSITGYISPGYAQIEPIELSVPVVLLKSIAEVNKARMEQYPFLTFRDFDVSAQDLEGLSLDTLLDEAADFYRLVYEAMQFGIEGDYSGYLAKADAAMALAGRNKFSTLLYGRMSVLSDLYNMLAKKLDNSDENQPAFSSREISVRLGASMDMEELIKLSYERLAKEVIPEDISISNQVERTGYYDEESNPDYPVITQNPIFWDDASLPVLEQFMRRLDFESVDLMVSNLDRYADLLEDIWKILPDYQEQFGEQAMSGSLIEYNDLLDYFILKLTFYTETGQYEKGLSTYQRVMELKTLGLGYADEEAMKHSGRFFETFGNYEVADSLYQLLDQWAVTKSEKRSDNTMVSRDLLDGYNQPVLATKLSGNEVDASTKREFLKHYKRFLDDGFVIDAMEVSSDRLISEKVGHLLRDRYFKLYQRNIDLLDQQNQYLASAEWMKELVYFLGRDGYQTEAIELYENLLFYEKLKMRAFRASFSEEAQVFYAKKQLEVFSRYLNLLLEIDRDEIPDSTFRAQRVAAFDMAMHYHSFILRGNYRLISQIFHSDQESVAAQYEFWRAYRQLLNQQYLEDETNQDMVNKIKKELEKAEKFLIRATRDSTSLFQREVRNFEEVRKMLQPGEVAIEMIRMTENHRIYYGSKPKYGAFILTPEKPHPELIAVGEDGGLMESKFINYYRSAIRYRLKDTLSYQHYWEDIEQQLPEDVRKIYFVPDGVYQLLNLNTLFNPADDRYLLDKYEIQSIPSLSFLNQGQSTPFKSAGLFGYPSYIDDPSITRGDSIFATSRNSLLENEIQSLPGTKKEVDEIGDILESKNIRVKSFTEDEVTKENLIALDGENILHIATHGYWTEAKGSAPVYSLYRSLSNSGLILSEAQTRKEDGFELNQRGLMTAAEIQNLVLFQTDLVVLSACETGLGEVVPGEGIFGLKRAFQKAGVGNLVTSLWKVSDEATQQFMRYFYTNITDTGSLNKALMEASLSLRKDYPDPYYWGAFTLMKFR